MTVMLALFFMMYSINGGATVYFAREVLGDANLVSPINSTLNIAQIVSMFLIAFFVKKFGKRNVFCAGLILDIAGMLLLAYSGGNMAVLITSSITAASAVPAAAQPCGQWFLTPLIMANGKPAIAQRVSPTVHAASAIRLATVSALLCWAGS